jgi:flagellar protein FliS
MNENEYFASRYQETSVNTSTSLHLIVMLYDAAICSLEEARRHMERKDIEGRNRALNKCNAIISELHSSLNLKEGGQIASSLNSLYAYMKKTLLRASIEQNPDLLVEVSGLLENLRSAWRQIDSGAAAAMESGETGSVQGAGVSENPQTDEDQYVRSFSISA